MDNTAFRQEIKQKKIPIVVEFWAPWCGPCKSMAPNLEKVSHEFEGQVELWKINADENPDILRAMGVMSIPTMIGFSNNEELFRITGALNPEQITQVFSAAQAQQKMKSGLSDKARLYRMVTGLAVMVLGGLSEYTLVVLVGLAISFTAVADRFPMYQDLVSRLGKFLQKFKKGNQETND
jgi:thioredoxin 1